MVAFFHSLDYCHRNSNIPSCNGKGDMPFHPYKGAKLSLQPSWEQ
jgi:hypothetical protein